MKTLVVLENVGIHYPGRMLFEKVNWTLYEGARVALAGRNGCGKSTLLKIMAGQLEPTDGQCSIVGKSSCKIGYLDQSLLDAAVLDVQAQGQNTQSPMAYIQQQMAADNPEIFPEEVAWEVRRILHGLGFSDAQMEAPLSELSGGWLLRMFIANTLLKKPDVLLLDEPTNHLDLSSIQWLEEFLENEYRGALVLVTHDVALQKRVTNSIAVLHGGSFFYRKEHQDYLSFLDSLKEEERILERNISGYEKKIKELKVFINKFRAKARMASRAQSKIKAMEKLEEEMKEAKEKLNRVQGFHYNLKFRFRMEHQGAKFPLSLNDLSFRYQENAPWILKNVSFDVKRGQKIAIIGDNGAGKTTLLNVIAGRLNGEEGSVDYGSSVQIGYFGQHQLDELSLENSVLENLQSKAKDLGIEQLRGWLGAFGFPRDEDIQKNAKVLSGGERARLAMLRILCSPCNVCLLDEPTNHLDIETKELLATAIKEFDGSCAFVSHDRDFVSQLADRIIYVSVDHKITDHVGSLDSFFEKFPERIRHLEESKSQQSDTPVDTAPSKPVEKLSYEERKRRKNRRRSLEKKLKIVESDLAKYGDEKEKLTEESSSDSFYETSNEERKTFVLKRISELEKLLNQAMNDWETMGTELESLQEG